MERVLNNIGIEIFNKNIVLKLRKKFDFFSLLFNDSKQYLRNETYIIWAAVIHIGKG